MGSTALSILFLGAPAWSQEAPTEGASAAEPVSGLEEITVTARKRTESLQDIPVAVSAFSAKQIERADLTSVEKIASATPQLVVGRASDGSGAQIVMRGIGSTSTSMGIEQSIATVVDGAYSGQGRVINEGFFDLERVEILKGPQALFFGKNATAGVISLTTADPGDELEIMGRAGYEFNAEQVTLEGVVSTPVTETLGIRVALRGSKQFGGLYRNLATDFPYPTLDLATGNIENLVGPASAGEMPRERELLGRVTVKWEPTDRLTATLKGTINRNKVNNPSWAYVPYACETGFSTLNPTERCVDDKFVTYATDVPAEIAAETPYMGDGRLNNKYRSWGLTGSVNYEMDDMSVTSVSNFVRNINSWVCNCSFQGPAPWASEKSKWRSFSNETRLLTNYDGPVNVMIGGFYQKTKLRFDQYVVFAGLANSAAPAGNKYVAYSKESETDGETISAFGQVIWKFAPQFDFTAGVRYIHETKDSYFLQPYVNPGLTSLFVPNDRIVGNQTFNDWAPEATLSWKPTDDINVYGAYKTAYKSGGFSNSGIYSGLSTTPAEDFLFDPEKADGFEVGLKTVLFERQLRLNLVAYRYEYSNLQLDFFNAATFANITVNAGAAVTKGAELDFEFAPYAVRGLTLRGSLNYNKARYRNFTGPCYSGQSVQYGCPSPTGPGGFPQQDLSGKPTAVAPLWTATLGGYYETDISDKLVFGLGADARYSDDYLGSAFGNPFSRVDSYITLDATARLGTADDRWEVALLAKNLTNQQYFLGGRIDGPLTGPDTGMPTGISADQIGFGAMPRTVQLQLTVRY